MTRINLVPPRTLHYRHLLAEYRELPRVYALARAWDRRGRDSVVPPAYTLGKGHVTFFYDKLGFISRRQRQLVEEMRRRGYTVNYPEAPGGLPPDLYGQYEPTQEAMSINLARLAESLERMWGGDDGEEGSD